jgi:hypothetical protein
MLEDVGFVGTTFYAIVVILLLYADGIVLFGRIPFDLDKQLGFFNDFCFSSSILVNTNKTKFVIIKSKIMTYPNFVSRKKENRL